ARGAWGRSPALAERRGLGPFSGTRGASRLRRDAQRGGLGGPFEGPPSHIECGRAPPDGRAHARPTMNRGSEWDGGLETELLARSPYRESEYFKRFAAGTLTREQAWGHVAQNYLVVIYFPRIFSGIHARCDELAVRVECAKHLLVEDLGYFRGRIGATPD